MFRTTWVVLCLALAGGTAACGAGADDPGDGDDGDADAESIGEGGSDGDADIGPQDDGGSEAAEDDGGPEGTADDGGSPDAADDTGDADASPGCTPDASSSAIGTAVFSGSTAGARNEPRTSTCPQGGPEALLAWTAPRSGYYRFDTTSSRFDTVLSVRRACDGPEIACNDDGAGIRSSLTLPAAEGETLLLTVDGAAPASSGDYAVDVTEVSGPQCDAPGYSCHVDFLDWRVGYAEAVGVPCAELFAEEPFELYDAADLVPGAQACACRCGAPFGVGCVAQLDCDYGAACVADGARDLSTSSCLAMSFGWDIEYSCAVTSPVPAGTGTCDSSFVETVHDAPTWSPGARFCSYVPSGTPCEPFTATVCAPQIPAGRAECIARRGTWSCPTPYAVRTLSPAGLIEDTRRCDGGSCGCGPASATACDCPATGGCEASFHTSDFCGPGTLVEQAPVGGCTTFRWLSDVHAGRASLTGAEPVVGDCAPTGAPASSGTVRPVPESVVTVCCKALD